MCEVLGAEAQGTLTQRDTYFDARHGRLKLREEEGATAHLIAYERSDLIEQRESKYRIVVIEDADRLKAALADALGVKVEVVKERRLFISEGARIHLDRVDGLGNFIEFEAIVGDHDAALPSAEAKVSALRRAFEIEDADLRGVSYSDMALVADGG
ncbi:MAG: putative Adenylate cyclase [Solirubrobacterales bacterium]|nr:putative Adenylate cyclase [Solirubrobacterales bacterium]